ncbi:MAG TPA: cytochrome c oxidase subunit I [Thermomicrobiales bacterium]|nr:cytochrome c oxidase subunit I [Thermomicrobiales bacterium]
MATLVERLDRTWEAPTGAWSWLTSTDHKLIGRRYLGTAFFFFIIAGIGALLMRIQLALPRNTFLGPDTYNGIFTLHGTTMIFLVSTPILFGFANFMVPLMIGSRDMAFPRVNALSWYIFLFAGLLLWSSIFFGAMPDDGWFNYVPLSGPEQSTGRGIDFYLVSIVFLTVATTAGSINVIVTAFKMRAPGMSVRRIPIFIWTMVVTSFAVIFAYPALTAANILLYMDRHHDTLFFNPTAQGDPLLWQHLFWIFGHPDVYIIFLPAVGIVSTIIPVFSRHRLVAYPLIVLATVAIGVVSFGVWVHHMFAVGIPDLTNSFFAGATILITIPSGIQYVAWVATIWRGNVIWKSPFLFVFGFFVLFLIGGFTGVMFGVIPIDRQVTDSYFVVAHFHYVLFGGAIFPVFAGLHYWWPKMTGRMLHERWAQLTFWFMFVGFNMTFFPMHILGLLGMPRRVYTYNDNIGWDALNFFQTVGAFVLGFGVLLFIINAIISTYGGEDAGPNPWEANTLEWAVNSPPPPYNFVVLPVVRSADPLWDPPTPEGEAEPSALELADGKETYGSSILDAEAERVLPMPQDSPWPMFLAIGALILAIGLLFDLLPATIIGIAIATIVLVAWTWPPATKEEAMTL